MNMTIRFYVIAFESVSLENARAQGGLWTKTSGTNPLVAQKAILVRFIHMDMIREGRLDPTTRSSDIIDIASDPLEFAF